MSDEKNVSIDELVEDYVRIRDAVRERTAEYKAFKEKAEATMARIEMRIMEVADKIGVVSLKTKIGTAFITHKDYARVAGPEGWEALCKYMVETNDFGLVEKRVAKLHFKEVIEQKRIDPKAIGVEYVRERVIQVRK